MTRGVKVRLVAFVVLSALGILYVTASYLGVVDKVTGREILVSASLPGSGGLFEGSEVTYRGVKIGKVTQMSPTEDGVDVDMVLEPGTELPVDSAVRVHNLSAVGEQYLDFQPSADEAPYAEDGTRFEGDEDTLPVDEADLLVDLDAFVNSVDKQSLRDVVKELGLLFDDTGADLQRLLDNGSAFIDEASAHTDETVSLLENGLTVLRTQQDQQENIRKFAADLSTVTRTLRDNDRQLRTILSATPGAAREFETLLEQLEPTIPVLLGDLITVDQVLLAEIDGIEQLLVSYPALLSAGPTGSTSDGFGHINLQFDYSVPPCTEGYLPLEQWREPSETNDVPRFNAECTSPPPYQMRGPKRVPAEQRRGNVSPERDYSVPYDPATGQVPGLTDGEGNPVRVEQPENLSVLGGDAWKWLLVGPVARK
ncbi:MCE family protein [Nocardioides panacisoli]|uniref:MlaD family protein n=1 Tax=Nocardioides panacisoli TaxID=627624 RepID=UPI001C63A28A|nr:MlaD family protein [Nocardioides panacisoli]QYJ04880.1 MCE family protein [Nocardioides panacisoli]